MYDPEKNDKRQQGGTIAERSIHNQSGSSEKKIQKGGLARSRERLKRKRLDPPKQCETSNRGNGYTIRCSGSEGKGDREVTKVQKRSWKEKRDLKKKNTITTN